MSSSESAHRYTGESRSIDWNYIFDPTSKKEVENPVYPSIDENCWAEVYHNIPAQHAQRIFMGALHLLTMSLAPNMVNFSYDSSRKIMSIIWNKIENVVEPTLKHEKLFEQAIERLHISGWAHGDTTGNVVPTTDGIYLIHPEYMFNLDLNTNIEKEPESWVREWARMGYDGNIDDVLNAEKVDPFFI